MKTEKPSETTKSLFNKYRNLRTVWLNSENSAFDDELIDFFDEFEDYFDWPMGN